MSGLFSAGTLQHGEIPATAKTPTTIATLRFSSHGYTSRPGDTPANTHFDARILGDVNFEQSITLAGGSLGRAALGFGEVALHDGDGALFTTLSGYAVDGRALRIRVADGKGARIGAWPAIASFSTVFAGTAVGLRRDARALRVRLRDVLSRLQVPAQTTTFAGTGGVEGGANLKGLPKPQAWGQVFNVSPAYLGVTDLGAGSLATFAVHFRAISAIAAVRERGGALTEVTSGTPGIGQFRVFASQGVFQLGFTPAGTITADVLGDASPFYAFTVGKLVRRFATDLASFNASTDFDDQSFDDFDFARSGAVGIYVAPGERLEAIDLVERLAGGAGGFVTQTRGGKLRLAVLAPPEVSAHASLAVGDIRTLAPADLPDTIDPPPKRVEVGYSLNYTPTDDLAASISGDLRSWLAQPWRSAAAYSGTVAATYALAPSMALFASAFADEAPAQTMADAFLALYAPGRRRFRVVTGRYLGQIELGYTVSLTWPLYGLASGWRGIVEGIREDWLRGVVELTLFG
jgi:hypothetical protein